MIADTHAFFEEKEDIMCQLISAGLPEWQAKIAAECWTVADIYGVKTHGKAMLPAHIKKIEKNEYNLFPNIQVIRETAAFAIIDGDNALGPVSAKKCMDYAIKKCSESGVFTVFSRNNNTFGPAFYYPLLAAEKNMIGIVTANSPAQIAPAGGLQRMFGTNPISAVIPVTESEPIIIDFAISVAAKSKLKEYIGSGMKIPEGWALDCNGNPTTDPVEAINGFMLPMSGFKGYGLALLTDILSGLLSGAEYLDNVGKFYSENGACMNVGYCITVIDPRQVYGDEYDTEIKKYIKKLRNSKTVDGQKIVLPGDDRIDYKNGMNMF